MGVRRKSFPVAACVWIGCATAIAQPIPSESSTGPATSTVPAVDWTPPSYFLLLKRDATEILTAPVRWDSSAWTKVALGAAAVGAVMLVDEKIRDLSARYSSGTIDRLADTIEPFGADYSWGVLAGFYGAGKLFDDPRASAVAQDGLASSLIAAGLITPALKAVTGRRRPSGAERATDFGRRGSSFPSGHATQAFAVAAVIAEHYDAFWVDALAYGTAGLVGCSRVVNKAHFASDVLLGAAIGVVVGKAVVRLNTEQRGFRLAPMVTRGGGGISVQVDLGALFGSTRSTETWNSD
jgi:hypothetical protein